MINEETTTSAFNLALLSLQRLNTILSGISFSYINHDFENMLVYEKTLFREIFPKLTKAEKINFKQSFQNSEKIRSENHRLVHELKFLNRWDIRERKSILRKIKINRAVFVQSLENLDCELRTAMERLNMLIPSSKDARFIEGLK